MPVGFADDDARLVRHRVVVGAAVDVDRRITAERREQRPEHGRVREHEHAARVEQDGVEAERPDSVADRAPFRPSAAGLRQLRPDRCRRSRTGRGTSSDRWRRWRRPLPCRGCRPCRSPEPRSAHADELPMISSRTMPSSEPMSSTPSSSVSSPVSSRRVVVTSSSSCRRVPPTSSASPESVSSVTSPCIVRLVRCAAAPSVTSPSSSPPHAPPASASAATITIARRFTGAPSCPRGNAERAPTSTVPSHRRGRLGGSSGDVVGRPGVEPRAVRVSRPGC